MLRSEVAAVALPSLSTSSRRAVRLCSGIYDAAICGDSPGLRRSGLRYLRASLWRGHSALREEKVREDDLRRLGYGFMRCYWEDPQNLRELERKLLRARFPG